MAADQLDREKSHASCRYFTGCLANREVYARQSNLWEGMAAEPVFQFLDINAQMQGY